jgi:hypothetical protein
MPVSVYYTIVDDKGDKSTVEVPLPDATALTDVEIFVEQMGLLIDPLVQGGIVGAGFRVEASVASFTNVASTIADVQEKGRFLFRTAGNWLKSLSLPTFSDLLINPGSNTVDETDTDVAAFITAMEDGIDLSGAGGSGVIQPSDYRGDDIATLEKAVEAWGNARG